MSPLIPREERDFLPVEQGQMSLDELHILYETAASLPLEWGPVLEVGSLRGLSASALTLAGGLVVCVDHWRGSKPHEEEYGKRDWFPEFQANALRTGRAHQIIAVHAGSAEALPLMKPEVFRMVFIDGDHDYQPILTDLRNAWPLLRFGGVMVLDDFQGEQSDGVVRACYQFELEHGSIEPVTPLIGTKLGIIRKEMKLPVP